MNEHLSACTNKAGFTYSFDNGKIIDYQDNFKFMGDVPFSICFDFETTMRSVVFFDAKIYVVSYCMIVAFHPDLDLPRNSIFRSYDQTPEKLTSLSHFEALQRNFFSNVELYNRVTLKQLEDAARSVWDRERNTALAEMFNVKLKFTVDTLKKWFNKYIKERFLELDDNQKTEFREQNPIGPNTLCSICYFPLEPRTVDGWRDHVIRSEHLFLENIYSKKEMKLMGIDDFEFYSKKVNQILDNVNAFRNSLEAENRLAEWRGIKNEELDLIVSEIKKIQTSKKDENEVTKEKAIAYLYWHAFKVLKTGKVKGDVPISQKFLSNMIAIVKDQKCIHHSHVTGKIVGHTHSFCNERENYFTIPVFAHNLFRFDFFFFLKGIRPSIWGMTDISIGGKMQQT